MTREDFLARLKRPVARLQNSRTDWYRIQAKADGPAEIFIYDEIGYFGDSAKAFAKELADIKGDLVVHLNSPGGDIFDGLAIYQALKDRQSQVTVKIDGLAASIASVIAMAGDKVIIAPKASMMVHDGWTMAVGSAKDMRKTADLLDKQSDIIASVYADKTGHSAEFWRQVMSDDAWYNAEEALQAGLVDEIEGQERNVEDPFDLDVYAHAGRDKAPAPVIKPPASEPAVEPVATVVPAKNEEPEFEWDFKAFQNALREGVK